MLLGIILGSLLGSKSHPKVDQKSIQILDRFLIDFGSQCDSILAQFWVQKSIKNQSQNLKEKEPRMNMRTSTDDASPESKKCLREDPFIKET